MGLTRTRRIRRQSVLRPVGLSQVKMISLLVLVSPILAFFSFTTLFISPFLEKERAENRVRANFIGTFFFDTQRGGISNQTKIKCC